MTRSLISLTKIYLTDSFTFTSLPPNLLIDPGVVSHGAGQEALEEGLTADTGDVGSDGDGRGDDGEEGEEGGPHVAEERVVRGLELAGTSPIPATITTGGHSHSSHTRDQNESIRRILDHPNSG